MTTQHTQGRLKVGRISHSEQSAEIDAESSTAWMGAYPWEGLAECRGCNENKTRGSEVMEANARRLVACWNRLEKFTTEQIEDLGYDLFADVRPDFERAMREHDELLAALKAASNYIDVLGGDSKGHRQTIAKVEGKS